MPRSRQIGGLGQCGHSIAIRKGQGRLCGGFGRFPRAGASAGRHGGQSGHGIGRWNEFGVVVRRTSTTSSIGVCEGTTTTTTELAFRRSVDSRSTRAHDCAIHERNRHPCVTLCPCVVRRRSRSFFVSSSSLLVVLGRSLLPPAWCFSRRNNNNNYSLVFFFFYYSRHSPRPL